MANILNLQLENFRAFVNSDAAADQAAQMSKGTVDKARWTASWGARLIHFTDNAKAAIAENNRVRNAFVSALQSQFNVQSFDALPAAVRAALVGSHAATAEEDFGFNADHKATSGKPLTKRRIAAALAAVEQALGAGARLPTSPVPATDEQIKARLANADELVDSLLARFQTGLNDRPLVLRRDTPMARVNIQRFVEAYLAHMGDGQQKHNRAEVFRRMDICVSCMGVLGEDWLRSRRLDENGLLIGGEDYRKAFVAKALEEVLLEYNERHADSAFYDVA